MKRIITSASLAALGAASLQAAFAPGLSPTETAKPWSVSVALRGFYDDNYATVPSVRYVTTGPGTVVAVKSRGSFGFEVSPRAGVNYSVGTTLLTADYTYGLRYYEDRPNNSADHSHQINASLQHGFSEQYKLTVSDSFVVAQEPEILDPSNIPLNMKLRTDGNNIRNAAQAKLEAKFTRLLEAQVSYANSLWAYDQKGVGSYSALLDRMEHLATVDFLYNALENTSFILGYQYGQVDFTSNEITAVGPAKFRDNDSHYVYGGIKQNFTQQLSGALRAGVQYTEYPNTALYANAGSPTDKLSGSSVIPYVDAYASYAYAKGSQVLAGVRHSRVQTDLLALDEEATTFYAAITHALSPKLTGSLTGNYQHGTYHQNTVYNGQADDYYSIGLNLGYQINQYLVAETGYSLDRLDSDVASRSFTRNRVFIGIRASY